MSITIFGDPIQAVVSVCEKLYPEVNIEIAFEDREFEGEEGGEPMKGPWKIESNLIGDRKMYRIFRLLDTNAVDHSGNREYAGEYVEDRKTLEIAVEQMNKKESPREAD